VLVELGLVLLLVTIIINCLARFLLWRVQSGRWGGWPWSRPAPAVSSADPVNGAPLAGRVPETAVPERPRLVERTANRNRLAAWTDKLMTGVLAACLLVTLGPLFLILGDITWRGVTSLNLAFFTNLPLDEPAGLAHAVAGSIMMVALATVAAVPVGLLTAIFLVEYGTSRLAGPVRFIGELLAGVPSIVVGIFAYALVGSLTGPSGWAGAFALAVMMIPIVMRASEEALRLVPPTLRNASYALGAAHWQTVVHVTVPAALSAIITGVFLAVARIAGETAPLLLTADATTDWNLTLNGPTPYLTYYIYHWSKDVSVEHNQVAWAGAFVLLALVMLLNVGVRLATGKRLVSAARAD
jgi:phosphate transport system permease protein